MAWLQFGSVFPLSVFLSLSSSISSSFIAAVCPTSSAYPLSPLFSGCGSPSWGSHCCIVANVGSYVSFNDSGKGAAAAILWDRVPAFLGMSVGSVYTSGRYVSLVVFISGRLMLAPVFCSYHFG